MRSAVICLSVLLFICVSGLTGCRVAGKSFHISSDSQTPVLGLHLIPGRKKKAKEVQSATYDQDFITRSREESGTDEEEEVKQASGSRYSLSRWKKWLKPLSAAPKHIPLPRTDLSPDDEADPKVDDSYDSVDDF